MSSEFIGGQSEPLRLRGALLNADHPLNGVLIPCRNTAFNDGMRTLERVRNGGKQTVVVQRIEVKDNAQAVVAGSVVRKGRKGGGDGRL